MRRPAGARAGSLGGGAGGVHGGAAALFPDLAKLESETLQQHKKPAVIPLTQSEAKKAKQKEKKDKKQKDKKLKAVADGAAHQGAGAVSPEPGENPPAEGTQGGPMAQTDSQRVHGASQRDEESCWGDRVCC